MADDYENSFDSGAMDTAINGGSAGVDYGSYDADPMEAFLSGLEIGAATSEQAATMFDASENSFDSGAMSKALAGSEKGLLDRFEDGAAWVKEGYKGLSPDEKKFAWAGLFGAMKSLGDKDRRKAETEYYRTRAKADADRLALEQQKQLTAATSAGPEMWGKVKPGLINAQYVPLSKPSIQTRITGAKP